MANAMPQAIGAALACPDKQVMAFLLLPFPALTILKDRLLKTIILTGICIERWS